MSGRKIDISALYAQGFDLAELLLSAELYHEPAELRDGAAAPRPGIRALPPQNEAREPNEKPRNGGEP